MATTVTSVTIVIATTVTSSHGESSSMLLFQWQQINEGYRKTKPKATAIKDENLFNLVSEYEKKRFVKVFKQCKSKHEIRLSST